MAKACHPSFAITLTRATPTCPSPPDLLLIFNLLEVGSHIASFTCIRVLIHSSLELIYALVHNSIRVWELCVLLQLLMLLADVAKVKSVLSRSTKHLPEVRLKLFFLDLAQHLIVVVPRQRLRAYILVFCQEITFWH